MVRAEEIERVAGALGQTVTGWRTLAGGFSHETCVLELGSDRAVVRLGGTDPAVEAAAMAAAGACVRFLRCCSSCPLPRRGRLPWAALLLRADPLGRPWSWSTWRGSR